MRGAAAACKVEFSGYYEGEAEKIMHNFMLPTLQTSYCATMQHFDNITATVLTHVHAHRQTSNILAAEGFSHLSYFKYNVFCERQPVQTVYVAVEPLYGPYRHPYSIDCLKQKPNHHLMSLNYLLTSHSAAPNVAHSSAKFMFDLGASVFNDLSQSRLLNIYQSSGITFDRHLMWEAKPRSGPDIFNNVPADHHHSYQYFNIPAIADQSDARNPLNILKKITSVNDFVVLKLDIDSPRLEAMFLDYILSDAELSMKIDELYWEPHFHFPELIACCWRRTANMSMSFSDVFQTLQSLRTRGIRAHGWP